MQLSRIETGISKSSEDVIERLFQRLGKHYSRYVRFRNELDSDIDNLKFDIRRSIVMGEHEKHREKLEEFLATYYLFMLIVLLVYLIGTLLIYIYIRKVKGVEIIKYREDNYIFLFYSLIVKAAIIPILLLTLAISIVNLNDLSQQRKDFELRSEIYQNYILLCSFYKISQALFNSY